MMTIATKEISNELMNAYKNHKLVIVETNDDKLTGSVAAVNHDQAFIKRPAKGVEVIKLENVRQVKLLNQIWVIVFSFVRRSAVVAGCFFVLGRNLLGATQTNNANDE